MQAGEQLARMQDQGLQTACVVARLAMHCRGRSFSLATHEHAIGVSTIQQHCKQPNDSAAASLPRPRLHPTSMRSTTRPGAGKSGTRSGTKQALGRQPAMLE